MVVRRSVVKRELVIYPVSGEGPFKFRNYLPIPGDVIDNSFVFNQFDVEPIVSSFTSVGHQQINLRMELGNPNMRGQVTSGFLRSSQIFFSGLRGAKIEIRNTHTPTETGFAYLDEVGRYVVLSARASNFLVLHLCNPMQAVQSAIVSRVAH